MQSKILAALVALVLSWCGAAHAQDVVTPVACRAPSSLPGQKSTKVFRQLADFSGYGGANSIGDSDVRIVQLAGTYSQCHGSYDGRFRFEGSLAAVDNEGRKAYSGLVGAGYQFAAGAHGSITPVVRLGYENFKDGPDQVVFDAAVMASTSVALGPGGDASLIVLELTPEYVNRQASSALNDGLRFRNAAFTNYAAVGYDRALGDHFRGKFTVSHRYIGGGNIVSSIGGVSVSLRPLSLDCAGYCWNFEASYSRGDSDYEGALISISRRFGQ
jgi:hypothetical protein